MEQNASSVEITTVYLKANSVMAWTTVEMDRMKFLVSFQ